MIIYYCLYSLHPADPYIKPAFSIQNIRIDIGNAILYTRYINGVFMNGSLFPVVHVSDHTGKIYTFSYEVAEFFGKNHKDILRDIRAILSKDKNFAAQFCAAKYKVWGRKEPCYRISEQGFGFLITKFTGSRFDQLKMAYVEQFTAMRHCLPVRKHCRIEAKEMCSALEDHRATLGKETQDYHYMNEHRLCDLVLLGCSVSDYKKQHQIPDDLGLADFITPEQVSRLDVIRGDNHELIGSGVSYEERKKILMDRFCQDDIEGECLLLEGTATSQ